MAYKHTTPFAKHERFVSCQGTQIPGLKHLQEMIAIATGSGWNTSQQNDTRYMHDDTTPIRVHLIDKFKAASTPNRWKSSQRVHEWERERDTQKDTKTVANVEQNQNCLRDKHNPFKATPSFISIFWNLFQQRKHRVFVELSEILARSHYPWSLSNYEAPLRTAFHRDSLTIQDPSNI